MQGQTPFIVEQGQESVLITRDTDDFCPAWIHIRENAVLHHYRLYEHLKTTALTVKVGQGARYDGLLLLAPQNANADISCTTVAELDGTGAAAVSNAIYLGSGKQRAYIELLANHNADDTFSQQLSNGALTDSADFDFKGLIQAKPFLKGITGDQLNQALILSDDARLKCSPELAILTEDVKCTHGASLGDLDDDALFYMQSRGIALSTAKRLLGEAFLKKLLDTVQDNDFKHICEQRINEWLKLHLR